MTGGAGILAALAIVSQLKGYFITREEGKAMSDQIYQIRGTQTKGFDDLKLFIVQGQEDQIHKLERLNDKIIERIRDTEARETHSLDIQEHRLSTLEAAAMQSHKTKTN